MRPFWSLIVLILFSLVFYTATGDATHRSDGWDITWILWAYYSILVLLVACFTCIELPRHEEERFFTSEEALVQLGETNLAVRLTELWPNGACVMGAPQTVPGARMSLHIEDIGPVAGRVTSHDADGIEMAFDMLPGLRDRMLLKLFSGRYRMAPEESSFSDVVRGVTLRFLS